MSRVALAAVVVVVVVSPAATETGGASVEPTAFQRPARPDDHYAGPSRWQVSDSRLVARATVRRPSGSSAARLYLVRRTDGVLCIALRDRGTAASCTTPSVFAKGISLSGRLLVGVVPNHVMRLVVVGTRGVRHSVKPTRDKGFIWDCRAWNGCAGAVAAVEAYNDAGRLLYRIPWS
jgi:hypothetical protein